MCFKISTLQVLLGILRPFIVVFLRLFRGSLKDSHRDFLGPPKKLLMWSFSKKIWRLKNYPHIEFLRASTRTLNLDFFLKIYDVLNLQITWQRIFRVLFKEILKGFRCGFQRVFMRKFYKVLQNPQSGFFQGFSRASCSTIKVDF